MRELDQFQYIPSDDEHAYMDRLARLLRDSIERQTGYQLITWSQARAAVDDALPHIRMYAARAVNNAREHEKG